VEILRITEFLQAGGTPPAFFKEKIAKTTRDDS